MTFRRVLLSTVIAIGALLVILLVGVRIFGVTPYTVVSGSMEPEYHVGSLIYVKPIDTNDLKVNDCITFRKSGGLVVTHRIIGIGESEGITVFKTKGDANNVADEGGIGAEQVIGKPVFTIPYLGYVANFVQNPPGLYIVIGGTVILILLSFLKFGDDEEAPKTQEE